MSLNGVECIIGEKEGECKSYFKALINQKLKKKKNSLVMLFLPGTN